MGVNGNELHDSRIAGHPERHGGIATFIVH